MQNKQFSSSAHPLSMSDPSCSHASLAVDGITRYGPRIIQCDVFTCEGAVDAHRLLSLVRKDICQLAGYHGWNTLTDERWRCKILKKRNGKKSRYTVKVCYEATIARSSKQISECFPAELDATKSVNGVMTILKREAKQKVISNHKTVVNWWERLVPQSQPWSCGGGYITVM